MVKKILLIDDDPAFRELISILLENSISDIQITEAEDAHQGEKIIKELNIYDVILLDYRMPNGKTGIDFLESTNHLLKDSAVIMITSEGNEAVAATAFRLGVTDYFIKGPDLMNCLMKKMLGIFERQSNDEDWKSMNPNSAHSGIELIKRYQDELNNLDTESALQGESMMLEFQEISEFNKFSKLVKFLKGVKIDDTKILDSKYVLLLTLKSTRYQRISSMS
ncbi:MAG: response regulator [Thermoplasmata archaeon]|nr:response regulator [Thermoplasmata archaeon]